MRSGSGSVSAGPIDCTICTLTDCCPRFYLGVSLFMTSEAEEPTRLAIGPSNVKQTDRLNTKDDRRSGDQNGCALHQAE